MGYLGRDRDSYRERDSYNRERDSYRESEKRARRRERERADYYAYNSSRQWCPYNKRL